MDDIHYDSITYRKNGATLILQFPKAETDTVSLIRDIKSILSAELSEQLHTIRRKDL